MDEREEGYVLEVSHMSKSFGGTHALKDVQLHLKKGEVLALLGENGAGKSTLMKCVIGLIRPDGGSMTFEGKPYMAKSPAEALQKGISMIHQELNPESIFLNREDTTRGIFLNKKKTEKRAQKILDQFGFEKPASMLMEELSLAEAQMIEIIRAVSCDAKVIIMDEPTSSLDSAETDHLFNTIRSLKQNGVSIIYISHRMEEIFEICDRVTVFRDGMYIGDREISGTDKKDLISMMVGRSVNNIFPKVDCEIGNTVFKVENISGKGFKNISFEVHAGEILGIAGLVGSGRSETMRAIFGIDPLEDGKIFLEGKEIVIHNPTQAIEFGLAMVNEDRKNYGLCLNRSIRENVSLPSLYKSQKKFILNQRREKDEVRKVSKELSIKASSIESEANSLSGGNQQKVVLAKWIKSQPKVLILDEPTRGVDVGAKAEIHSLMSKFAANGMAIIMISSELPEVMGMSDRILVYSEGQIYGEIHRNEIINGTTTQESILALEFGQ